MALEHIKIPNVGTRIGYNVAAGTSSVTIPFTFFEPSDIVVISNGVVLTLGVHYTVVGTGGYDKGFPGGTVVFLQPPTVPSAILVDRQVPIERTVDFPNSGPLQTAALNTELDKSVAIDQQLKTDINALDFRIDVLELGDPRLGRAMLFPPEDLALNHSLPSIGNRAQQTLGFDAVGNIQMRSALTLPDKVRDVVLPLPFNRINKVLGWDATGDNVTLLDVVAGTIVPNSDSISYVHDGATVARSVGEALRERLSIKDFHANVGAGIQANDDAALYAAIVYMNALPTTGATLFYPDGVYFHAACPVKLVHDNCTIEGEGANSAMIVMNTTGPWVSIGDINAAEQTNFVTIRNLDFRFAPAADGCAVAHLENTYSCRLQEIRVTDCDIFVHLGISVGVAKSGAFHTYVQDCSGTSRIAGYPLFDLHYGGGLYVSDCNFANNAAPGTAPVGKFVFGSETVSFTTVRVHQCYFLNYDVGLWIRVSSTATASDYIITNCSFVGMNRWGAYIETGTGGVVVGIRIFNSQIDCYNQDGVLLLGSGGQSDNHAFVNNAFTGAGRSAFASVATAQNIVVANNRIANVNKAGIADGAIQVFSGTGYTIVANVGNNPDSFTRAQYGIVMGAGTDQYLVTANRMGGLTGSYRVDPDSVASHERRMTGNAYASATLFNGYATIFGAALDASGNWINTTPFVVDAIVGGTDFITATAINGVSCGFSTIGTYRLEPGDIIRVQASSPSLTIRRHE